MDFVPTCMEVVMANKLGLLFNIWMQTRSRLGTKGHKNNCNSMKLIKMKEIIRDLFGLFRKNIME